MLYGKHAKLLELENVNHYFVSADTVPGKLEPGNANYELSYGAAGIVDYIEALGRRNRADSSAEEARAQAFTDIANHEESIVAPLLQFLAARPDIEIIGSLDASQGNRVPTVSFVHHTKSAEAIVTAIDAYGIGIRFGHFYAIRLIEALELAAGVVRVSMVHYNTLEEVQRLIDALTVVLE